jgi:hypothetical protein
MRLDMHELLETARAGDPPMRHSTDDFVTGGRRRRTRRRMAWATSAAGAVLAVATVTVVPQMIVGNDGVAAADQQVMLYPVSAFDYTLSGYTVGGIEVSDPVNVTPGYQQARIRRADETQEYDLGDGTSERALVSRSVLTVYRAGVFDPVRFEGAESVPVGGATGFYAGSALAWQYGPDAWAVIEAASGHLSRADMLDVATAMRTGPNRPATLPWRMSYLPPGYHLSSMGTTADDQLVGPHLQQGDARFTTAPEEYSALTRPLTGEGLENLRVKVYPRSFGDSFLAKVDWSAGQSPSADASNAVTWDPSNAPSWDPSNAPTYEPSYEPSVSVSDWPSYHSSPDTSDGPSGPSGQTAVATPFCVPGKSVCYRYTADGTYLIEATATAVGSGEELLKVLRGMRVDDPADGTTWSELGDALPGVGR